MREQPDVDFQAQLQTFGLVRVIATMSQGTPSVRSDLQMGKHTLKPCRF